MKTLFLIPPSEWKYSLWEHDIEKTTHQFSKPYHIAKNATAKDLKCQWMRHELWIHLNKNIEQGPFCPAIQRYNGVMFKAINYSSMSPAAQTYFDDHFLIVSGLYGLLAPKDLIANYKLPIETKALRQFRWTQLTDALNSLTVDIIVDLLPLSYKKVIDFSSLKAKVISIDFLKVNKKWEKKKLTHGIKTIKGKRIHDVCEKWEIMSLDNNNIEIIL